MVIQKSESFYKDYSKLDGILRTRVDRCLTKLAVNPSLPGLNVESVRGASPRVRSCRVTRGIRIIYEIMDSAIVRLLYVGTHDSVYKKATFYWLTVSHGEQVEKPAEDLGEFTMFNFDNSDLNEALLAEIEHTLNEVELSSDLVPTIARLIRSYVDDGTDGKAPASNDPNYHGDALLNVIPSQVEGQCKNVLIVFCFDGDSFNDRLREAAYHAGIHCPETKLVIMITSQWNAKEWKKNHEKAFGDLNAKTIIYFSGFSRLTRIC